MGPQDRTKHLLQEVYLVRCQVVEVSSAGNVALYAPRQVIAVVVEVARRHGKAYLGVDDVSYGPLSHQFLHFQEIRQIPPVVCHKTRHPRLLRNAVDALTVGV